MENKENKQECIICSGKYSVGAVASTCTTEPVCKEHIEEILKFLEEKKDKEPKHFPKPEYGKCNAGHQLVEVYNEKYNKYDWDCPICIKKMQDARSKE